MECGLLCMLCKCDGVRIGGALGLIAGPLSLCYAVSKLGCARFTCCDWKRTFAARRPAVSLGVLEAMLAATTAVVLPCRHDVRVFGAFLLAHGATRILSVWGQGRSDFAGALARPDSGLFMWLGVATLAAAKWLAAVPS
jgi:hypothetical protein